MAVTILSLYTLTSDTIQSVKNVILNFVNNMGDDEIKSIATLEAQFKFLNEAFVELKMEIKNVNGKLDAMIIEWQKFGGLYNSVSSQQSQINGLQVWKDEITPSLNTIKDSKKKLFNIFWNVVQAVTLAGVLYLLNIKK